MLIASISILGLAVAFTGLTLSGFVDSTAESIALVGVFLTSAVTLVGFAIRRQIDSSSQERLRLEAATAAANLLDEADSDLAGERTGAALLLLSEMGYANIALSLLGSLRDRLSGTIAAEVLGAALLDESDETQRWAANELVLWVPRLVRDNGLDWPGPLLYGWPDLSLHARRQCFHATVNALLEAIPHSPVVIHGFVGSLYRIVQHESNASIAAEAAGVLALLVPRYQGGSILDTEGVLITHQDMVTAIERHLGSDVPITTQTQQDLARLGEALRGLPH